MYIIIMDLSANEMMEYYLKKRINKFLVMLHRKEELIRCLFIGMLEPKLF